jgi:hypothetical protein
VKLLGTIDSIDVSDGEKARLVEALGRPDSRQRTILESNALLIRDNDFWRRTQKTFHITGFRDGNLVAKKKVLAKALENAKPGTTLQAWATLGSIYEKAVRIHIEHNLENLYQLLKTEDFVASSGSQTEQVFRCISRALPMHGASIEDAQDLYEIWSFDRTAQIDEILSSVTIRADDVRRMLAESLSTTRREISGAVAASRAELVRHLEAKSQELVVLRNAIDSVRTTTSTITSQIAAIESRVIISHAATKPTTPSKTAAGRAEQTKLTDSGRAHELLESMERKFETLARQVREQRKRLEALEPAVSNGRKPAVRDRENTTTRQVIERWSPSLEMFGITNRPQQAGRILLEVIRQTRVIITDKPEVISSLWKALQDGEEKDIFVSPLWLTEQDWKVGIDFLSDPEAPPRLLVLTDFDVAIQESYLVPVLKAWLLRQNSSCANRIALVPSNVELDDVSPKIFEVATLITQDASYLREMDKFTGRIKEPLVSPLVSQPSSAVFSSERIRNATAEQELRRYVWTAGVVLSSAITERFICLYEALQALLSPVDAASIAQSAVLLPWVRAHRGATVATSVQNAFTTLYAS